VTTDHLWNSWIWCTISGFCCEVVEIMLFWVIMQRLVVIPYRHFGTTYLSHLHWSRNPRRKDLRSALFCDMIQHMVVILYRHFGKNCWSHLRGQEILEERISWFLKMVLTGCPKMSVRKYHHMLRNTPEQHRSQLAKLFPAIMEIRMCHCIHTFYNLFLH